MWFRNELPLLAEVSLYSFLSQQSAISVHKRAGFLSLNRISELVCDSESEEAGASSNCIIYLDNRILCIFRQPLKYLCFSHSSLDGLRKYHVETLDSSSWKIHWKWWWKSVYWNSTQQKVGQSRFMTVTQLKCRMWTVSGVNKKVVSEVLRKYGVCVCVN